MWRFVALRKDRARFPAFDGPPCSPNPRRDEGTEKPSPDRALMIGAVACVRIPTLVTLIRWIFGRQTPQANRREQLLLHDLEDGQFLSTA